MKDYEHKLVAVYADERGAKAARQDLLEKGFASDQVRYVGPGDPEYDSKVHPRSRPVAASFIKAGIIGHIVGGLIGAAVLGWIWIFRPDMLEAVPVIGPLMIVGYSAYIAALIWVFGAFRARQMELAANVSSALARGMHVLVIHPRSASQAHRGEEVIEETPGRKEYRS